jgi:hypothetical protein
MKKTLFFIIVLFFSLNGFLFSQKGEVDHSKMVEDLNFMIESIKLHYAYLDEKKVDMECIQTEYLKLIPNIDSEEDSVLFFEYLINELYDSHLNLNTNRESSFRIFSPIYTEYKNGRTLIKNVWQSQLEPLAISIIDAEVLEFNNLEFQSAVDRFPSLCNDKNDKEVRTWIGNKIIAGRRNQARVLKLKLKDNSIINLDVDQLKIIQEPSLLNMTKTGDIGVIRINNSLGNGGLIAAFDAALDALMDTKGLILDLRNTVDGGDSYIARAIMGRFVDSIKPYQKHTAFENYGNHEPIAKLSIEYVVPRGSTYTKPVIVLVGRWTGSMGEGLAIGFEGMQRGEVMGTEMHRLAGAMYSFSFAHRNYSFRISREKLYHLNGTPREKYIPTHKIVQQSNLEDEFIPPALRLLKSQ